MLHKLHNLFCIYSKLRSLPIHMTLLDIRLSSIFKYYFQGKNNIQNYKQCILQHLQNHKSNNYYHKFHMSLQLMFHMFLKDKQSHKFIQMMSQSIRIHQYHNYVSIHHLHTILLLMYANYSRMYNQSLKLMHMSNKCYHIQYILEYLYF